MPYDPRKHHRQSIRLPGYDYTNAGMYFITVCVKDRTFWFGDVVNETVVLTPIGRIIQSVWDDLPAHYPGVAVDRFVVMPNHPHGIVVLTAGRLGPSPVSVRAEARYQEGQKVPLLGEVVARFKSMAYTACRQTGNARSFWQTNYYERIIRDGNSLGKIRYYITNNPRRWMIDPENPNRTGDDPIEAWLRGTGEDDGGNGM